MIWMVTVAEEAVGGVGAILDVAEAACLLKETVFGLGVSCFAFFAGTAAVAGSVACCVFLFAMTKRMASQIVRVWWCNCRMDQPEKFSQNFGLSQDTVILSYLILSVRYGHNPV